MTDNSNTNGEQDELSGDDYYDEYFGDDDVADPDFIPPTKIHKKSPKPKANTKIENESEDESSTYNKQVQRPSLLEFQRVLDVNASNNPLLENEVVRKRRSEILSSDDSDDFDPPDDYLDVNQKKSSQVSADRIRKKRKTDLKETCHTQKLDYRECLNTIMNLDQITSTKYDIKQEKHLAVEYFSSLVQSSMHEYILHVLPLFFVAPFLRYVKLTGKHHYSTHKHSKYNLLNFFFGVRQYLGTMMNQQQGKSEYLSKRCDALFRRLVTHKERQFCLMLSSHYLALRYTKKIASFYSYIDY